MFIVRTMFLAFNLGARSWQQCTFNKGTLTWIQVGFLFIKQELSQVVKVHAETFLTVHMYFFQELTTKTMMVLQSRKKVEDLQVIERLGQNKQRHVVNWTCFVEILSWSGALRLSEC